MGVSISDKTKADLIEEIELLKSKIRSMSREAEEPTSTYLIVHKDRSERKVTVPTEWKVTFGPAIAGMNKADRMGREVPMAIRFYKDEKHQKAIFTDVVSFRDISIPIEVKKITRQDKVGRMEVDGVSKDVTIQATAEEWVNPDAPKPTAVPQISQADVKNFDLQFEGE